MIFTEAEKEKLIVGCKNIGLEATNSQIDSLLNYANMVIKWNKVYNLTAIIDSDEVLTHHLLDCLSVIPFLDKNILKRSSVSLLDVGSGAGFPGLVIAIMRPELNVVVLDAVQKKSAFMRQVIGMLKLRNTQVEHCRVEAYRPNFKFDCIISRAFANVNDFILCTHHLLGSGGAYIAMKGKPVDQKEFDYEYKVIQEESLCVPFLNETRHVYQITR